MFDMFRRYRTEIDKQKKKAYWESKLSSVKKHERKAGKQIYKTVEACQKKFSRARICFLLAATSLFLLVKVLRPTSVSVMGNPDPLLSVGCYVVLVMSAAFAVIFLVERSEIANKLGEDLRTSPELALICITLISNDEKLLKQLHSLLPERFRLCVGMVD